MAKKSAKPKSAAPVVEPDSGRESHGIVAPITKAEAIRRALAAGMEGGQEGSAYILKEFGLDVSPGHFSANKAKEKQGAKPATKKGRPATQKVDGYLAPPPKPKAVDGDLLDAMEAMKPLVAALGAEKVKRIADLLS